MISVVCREARDETALVRGGGAYSYERGDSYEDQDPTDVLEPVPASSTPATTGSEVQPVERAQAKEHLDETYQPQGEQALREVHEPGVWFVFGDVFEYFFEPIKPSFHDVHNGTGGVKPDVDDGIGDEA